MGNRDASDFPSEDELLELLEDDDAEEFARLIVNQCFFQLVQSSSVGVSRAGRQADTDRGGQEGHDRILGYYFSENPAYGDKLFRHRFRMRRPLFIRILDTVEAHDNYFQRLPDATGKLGLSAIQKTRAAIRHLAYGAPADAADEYVRIGESTAIKGLQLFCRAVINVFDSTTEVTDEYFIIF
ncbi:hypothetical protein PsorP6_010872 [Peronosclerospora sorghi]|uniref:Uncharacterized protein n=1 Tax=Peronosclerospora sorghi TaxID=230839 RepID=A0ACC0VWC7_9STRA|nr:hypothetical protein PsorP6_010872 [Peronosclerospora sorghi]